MILPLSGSLSHVTHKSPPHAKPENGDFVIVRNDEEEATFKQYKQYGNMKILHPLNPRYNDIVLNKDKEYRIVGVVMEKKKRYK